MDEDNSKRSYLGKNSGTIIGILWQRDKDLEKKYVASPLHGYDLSERTVYGYIFRIQTIGTADRKLGSAGHDRILFYLGS